MLTNITVIFGLPCDQAFISTVISALGGVGGMSAVGRAIAANLIRMISGTGTVVGGVTSSATAASLTLVLGLAYIHARKIYMRANLKAKVWII